MSLLGGCILSNPDFDESATSEASSTATGSGVSWTGSVATTEGSSASGSASDGSTLEPTTGGETGTGDGGTTLSTGTSTGTSNTDTSNTDTSTSEASTGESEGSTSTGDPISCSEEEAVNIALTPTENTYVVTGGGEPCEWTDSNLKMVNPNFVCEVLNFGSATARYTLIGENETSRGEYLARFGVHQTMLDHPGMGIAGAELAIVPWWSQTRSNVTFSVGVVDYADVWVQGNKGALPAGDGDSNWTSRAIDGVGEPWLSGSGPAAGSLDAATISLGELVGGEHPVVTSGPIDPALLQPWVDDAANEQGFVLHTSIEPILVKNMDTQYKPILRLELCPI